MKQKRLTEPHKIDYDGLQQWLAEEEFLYASSSRERKRLVVKPNGMFVIKVSGAIVWQGTQPFGAVEAYNAITEEYVDNLKDFRI